MKILIVSGAFYPGISPRSFRTTELVKELVRRGNDVTLYIPETDYDYSDFLDLYPITIKFYRKRAKDRLAGKPDIFSRVIRRFLDQYFSYPNITIVNRLHSELKKIKIQYDLLITIVVPHQINWAVGKIYGKGGKLAKTWIADCGDPFMLMGNVSHYYPFYFKYIEKKWCRLCDYIACPIEGAINGYYPEFHNKVKVIPQAFNFDEVVLKEYKPHDVPTFAYSGNFVKGVCDPRTLLKFLSEKNIDFKFYIYTRQQEFVSPFKEKLGERLIINPFIPRLELIKELSTMDFLVNFKLNNTVQASSKVIDYSLTKRPILYVSYENMDECLVDQFLRGDYSGRQVLNDISKYDIHNVAQQFLDLCK